MNNFNQKIEINNVGRDYIVGDIHGCHDLLMEKLIDLDFDVSKDRLFSVGDLVDRGSENIKCLELLNDDWFYCVKGNHEMMMIESVINHSRDNLWLMNGGNWYLYLTDEEKAKVKELCIKANDLPLSITTQFKVDNKIYSLGISHAQPVVRHWDQANNLSLYQMESMVWGRNQLQLPNHWVKRVDYTIHGHTPLNEIVVNGNSIWIDRGAVYGILDEKIDDTDLIVMPLDEIPELHKRLKK